MNIIGPRIEVAGVYHFYLNGEKVSGEGIKNLITDFGWSRLLNSGLYAEASTQVQLGTGNTPPTVTDTALVSLLASLTGSSIATISGTDTIGAYRGSRHTYAFAQGAVVGNVAEVGWKLASADGSLSSRSLVKDGLGNPAVITVTAIDQLTVQYELRFYVSTTLSTTGSVSVAGVPTTWAMMAASNSIAHAANGGYKATNTSTTIYGTGFSMGSPGGDPGGPNQLILSRTLSGVTVNTTLNTLTFSWTYGTGDANVTGGIFGIKFYLQLPVGDAGGAGHYKVSFSPQIPKDSTKTCAFTFTVTFVRL